MHLHKIKAQNFLSIGEAEIEFNNSDLVLINGRNEDSPTSLSNGAGKSSIYDSIYWAFYGKTKRGYSGNDVINNTAKSECCVTAWFDDYKVVRARKHSAYDNGLFLYQIVDGQEVDLTKGTIKDTQELLTGILGMSELTFSKVSQFGQGDLKNFATMTDKELKSVFEEALGLNFFGEYYNTIKATGTALDERLEKLREKLRDLENESWRLQQKLDMTYQQEQQAESNYHSQKSMYEAQIGDAEADLKEALNAPRMTEADYQAQIGDAHEKKARIAELKSELAKVESEERQRQMRMASKRSQWESYISKIQRLQADIEATQNKIGSPCDLCGQPLTEDAVAATLDNLKSKLDETVKNRLRSEDELQVDASSIESLKIPLNQISGEIEAIEDQLKDYYSIEAMYKASKDCDVRIMAVTNRIDRLKQEYAAITKQDYTSALNNLKASLQQVEDETQKVVGSVEFVNTVIEDVGELLKIFGDGGVKSYLLDNVTPELNKLINKYMSMLDDMEVEVKTLKKLKTGDLREKFSISVSNRHGASNFKGQSGGEKQKINIAISLGFNALCRSVTDSSLNFLFLDEVFESLDAGSMEAVADLCHEFVKEVQNVFLITHQSGLSSQFDNSICIEKRGGRSFLAG
jgi:DNA repair exonuclease SbcCD ATPase subunit